MKKNVFTILTIFFISQTVFSQTLFIENFNYPVRDSLEGMGGWDRSGANSPFNVKTTFPGLTYTGYLSSGIGNTVIMTNEPNGDLEINTFGMKVSGKVYMSFMLKVETLTPLSSAGFNICLDQEGGTTNNNTRTYVRKVSPTTFNFGIRKSDSSAVYSSNIYSINNTYLVIVSYTFAPGNDTAKIYVSATGVPATEPATPIASDSRGFDVSDIGEVVLSNSYSQNGLQMSTVKIDGIRVGTTWSNTLFGNINEQLNFTGLIQGFYNNVTNKMVKDTARIYLRYQSSPYFIADSSKAYLDSLGKGSFIFNRIGDNAPYYLVFKHRNSIETWSFEPREFENRSQDFDFTSHANRAFGNNLIMKGSEFCFYSGDVNQDGVVDGTDGALVDNASAIFTSGYVRTDVNGDNFVDGSDAVFTDNNSFNFVGIIRP